MKNPHNLTDKQRRFCEEYMIDLNATQAAIRAGYSENTAKEIGSENLTKPNIAEYIQELQKQVRDRNKITVDECVQILSNIARTDIANFYDEENGKLKDIHSIPREDREAIEELSVFEEFDFDYEEKEKKLVGYTKKIKASGKQSAVDKLLKVLGGYSKHNEQQQSTINVNNLSKEALQELANAGNSN